MNKNFFLNFLSTIILCFIIIFGVECSNPETINPAPEKPSLSDNANLKSIKITNGRISPVFDNKLSDYIADVSNDAKTLKCIFETEDDNAAVYVNNLEIKKGEIVDISIAGESFLIINSHAQNKSSTKEYYIKIIRRAVPTTTTVTATTVKKSDNSDDTTTTLNGVTTTIGFGATTTLNNNPTVTTTNNNNGITTTILNGVTTTLANQQTSTTILNQVTSTTINEGVSTTNSTNPPPTTTTLLNNSTTISTNPGTTTTTTTIITTSTSLATTTTSGTVTTTTTTIPFNGIAIYFEKPDSWSEAWIWYDKDSDNSWETSVLKQPPGDMINYRTGWYKKEIKNASTVTFLFNDGTWNNKAQNNGVDFIATKNIWIQKNGTITDSDPQGPSAPSISASPSGGYFYSSSIEITLTLSGDNIISSKYTTDGSNPQISGINFNNGTIINVGSGTSLNETVTLKIFASNDAGTTTKEYNFTKKETPAVNEDCDSLIIYQVMVESFQDGDSARDYNTGYGPSHHKGDLKGITNSLTYIKNLGANAIWLTPIFNSDGSSQLDATGYFAKNFFEIDPKFGSLQDAKDLVSEAHRLNMYVFLDGVFGHHKGGVPASPSGYQVSGSNNPVSYPGSLNFFKEVATYWIDTLEIDGWRLDQAYQVSTKNQDRNYWKDIREAVEQKCSERKSAGKQWGILGYMVGEIWDSETNIQNWGYDGGSGNAGLKSCFDFPLRYNLVQVLATQEETSQSGAYNQSVSKLNDGYATRSSYSSFAKPNLMLTNHDLVRFGDLIQRAPHLGYGKANPDYWKRHKAAFSFMASYTGPITIYYGDEIGDEVANFVNKGDGGYYDDHVSRSSGQISGFDANQENLKNYLTSLMQMRISYQALWKGARTNLKASANQYADLKTYGNEKIVYCLNTSTSSDTITISQSLTGGSSLRDLSDNSTISANGGSYSIPISGLSGRFLIVE